MLSPLVSSTTYERFVTKADLVGIMGVARWFWAFSGSGLLLWTWDLLRPRFVAPRWACAHFTDEAAENVNKENYMPTDICSCYCIFWIFRELLKRYFDFKNKCNVGYDADLSGCSLALNRFDGEPCLKGLCHGCIHYGNETGPTIGTNLARSCLDSRRLCRETPSHNSGAVIAAALTALIWWSDWQLPYLSTLRPYDEVCDVTALAHDVECVQELRQIADLAGLAAWWRALALHLATIIGLLCGLAVLSCLTVTGCCGLLGVCRGRGRFTQKELEAALVAHRLTLADRAVVRGSGAGAYGGVLTDSR